MTTRTTANLVLGCALSAMTAGCTVHTYSARPEYASTVFVRHEPAQHEASFHTERSRERTTYRPVSYRPANDDVRGRTASERDLSRRDTKSVSRSSSKPVRHVSSKPSRDDRNTVKPSTGKKNDEHVELLPAKPEKTAPSKERPRALSFRERLERYVDKTDKEVAQKERERRERMSNAIGAAADRQN